MKQIYAIVLILFPFMGFSQLYISPDGNKSSYIYAENTVLFVEKNIDLTLNPSEEHKASMYLRDEAQLLQGNSASLNTGSGVVSIFQEGFATNFTYNYWCAPVSNTSVNNNFGNIFYEPQDRTSSIYAKISSSLDGLAMPLTISNKWVYKLSGNNYTDWEYEGNIFEVAPGEGFTMKGVAGENTEVVLYGIPNNPGGHQRYDFRGKPNNGSISLSIKKNLILFTGNPYPSALDLNLLLTENKNCTGIAYFWDSKLVDSHYLKDYEGGYGVYSPAAGDDGYVPAVFQKYDNSNSLTGKTGDYYARRFAPVGQGFLVIGKDNGDFTIKNEYRAFVKENPNSSQFKLKSAPQKTTDNPLAVLRLDVDFDKYTRQLLLINRPDATPGADQAMDAKNLSPLNTDASFIINAEDYLIDVRPYDIGDIIPLNINISEASEVNFHLAAAKDFTSDLFVLDTLSHVYHNVKSADFKVHLEQGNYKGRFRLAFKNLVIIKEDPLPTDHVNEYFIFQDNPESTLQITVPSLDYFLKIQLFDIQGREIIQLTVDKNKNYYEIPTRKLSKGVYVVKILGPSGSIVSKKIIISN